MRLLIQSEILMAFMHPEDAFPRFYSHVSNPSKLILSMCTAVVALPCLTSWRQPCVHPDWSRMVSPHTDQLRRYDVIVITKSFM